MPKPTVSVGCRKFRSGKVGVLEFSSIRDAVHRLTEDPKRYHDFISAWDGLLAAKDVSKDDLDDLAKRALTDLDQAERRDLLQRSFARDLNRFPYPTWMVTQTGRILAANVVATTRFGLGDDDMLGDLDCMLSGAEPVRDVLETVCSPKDVRQDIVLKKAYLGGDAAPSLMAFLPSRIESDGKTTSLVFLISRPNDADALALLVSSFGLTDAEAEILDSFLDGLTLDQIAVDRGRSLATVRTQFQSILSKAEAPTQAELVRTCLGLTRFSADVSALVRANRLSRRRTAEVLRPLGRSVEVVIVGSATARPVVYLHGAFVNGFPPAVEDAFIAQGFCLIGITRPRFGKTSKPSPGTTTQEALAGDIAAVLDQLGIDRCPLLAHSTATHHAYAVLDLLAERISGLVFAAGWPPPDLIGQIAGRSVWARVMMAAAVKSPAMLNIMSRAGIALFKAQGAAAQAARAVADCPADVRTVTHPDCAAELEAWIEHGSLQGIDAGLEDIAFMLKDWTPYLRSTRAPVVYVHGDEDPHVPAALIKRFSQQSGDRVRVDVVRTCGHFAIWQQPQAFIDALREVSPPDDA